MTRYFSPERPIRSLEGIPTVEIIKAAIDQQVIFQQWIREISKPSSMMGKT
jgi:hypothetical protein